jgi:predicted RNase H-like nuclease
MARLAGADGCPAGWICVTRDTVNGRIESALFSTARELIYQKPEPDVLMIDIPIGLAASGVRQCDQLARRLLGARACCVFSAPVRAALTGGTRKEASALSVAAGGGGISCQCWGIFRKIIEVDAVLRREPTLQTRVHEMHPEVSYFEWNGHAAILQRKASERGRRDRQRLIAGHFGSGAYAAVRGGYRVRDVAHDDIADAFAGLWSAERIMGGTGTMLPAVPPLDGLGLQMGIWW